MATTNIQSFAGDVEVSGELTVTGQLNSTTGSDKVKLTATTASETDYIPLSRGTTGAQPLYTDSNLTYNPSNNVIGANLSGNISGNATYAATAGSATHANAANTVAFTDRDTNNETDYIAFVANHTPGDKALFTDSNLTYNPANNAIGANITGSAAFATSATHANNANTVAFTDRDTQNETDYIAFVANHTPGDKALFTDSNLTYNPSNNHINANVPYANNAGFLGGLAASTNANANSIAQRDASGHLTMAYGFSTYLNMSHGVGTRNSDTVFYSSTDSYIRKNNATGMRSSLNVPTRTGGDASGTWSINVNGNAAYSANAAYATSAGSTGVLTGYQFYDAGNGYARIGSQGANKFLINWGASGNIAINSSAYQTFRAAFGAVYAIVSTRIEGSSAASYAWSHGQVSTSGFRIYSNGARAGHWYWIAVGR
ncbi:hypothetical protein OtV2_064 [Ostreococcus tauri virus 2]|uniref:hypothetical protein n=1 Tax=Ostreococcus tauri virus 2 TaxID=696472 RepID=UPI0001EF4814|nr:hypothetical protein OtV2_064 [Ostreococcus tauri virus 2]CBI70063.1 hypothetical protein OtV2_064 [Ostreococcus tauri virus 2]